MAKQLFRAAYNIGSGPNISIKADQEVELDPQDANTQRLVRVGALVPLSASEAGIAANTGGGDTTGGNSGAGDDQNGGQGDQNGGQGNQDARRAELEALNRADLEKSATEAGVQGLGKFNMPALIEETLKAEAAKQAEAEA